MNYLRLLFLLLCFFIYGFYIQIKKILIGIGKVKDKRYSEEKDLKRVFYKGIIGLIVEILIFLFISIMLS